MFDFKDEIITDRKVKELLTLQELLQKETIKHSEQENELRRTIEELHQKLTRAEDNVKDEYEKRIKEITGREESLIQAKGELSAKIRLLVHNLSITEEALKLKENEFLKIQHEKEEQVNLETKHLSDQIKWLASRVEEESSAHTETTRRKNAELGEITLSYERGIEKLRREIAEREQTVEKSRAALREIQGEKNRRETELSSQIRELTSKVETLNNLHFHERENNQKDIESKKQEIQALREALMEFQVKSEANSSILSAEFAEIKRTFDTVTKSLQNQLDEKQKNVISLEGELVRARQFLNAYEERINKLVVELEQKRAYEQALRETLMQKDGEVSRSLKAIEHTYTERLNDKEAEIEKLKAFFELQTGILQQSVKGLRAQINTLNKKILDYQYPATTIAAETSAPQGYICSSCGAPVDPNEKGCPSCGVAFHTE